MHALYVSQTGLTEPLAQSQILPYLRGLVRRGWTFDIVALEPQPVDLAAVEALRRELADENIHYLPGFRSPSHSKVSKVAQIATLVANAAHLAVRHRPRIIHARSDLPAVAAVSIAKLVPGARSIYDCRGFLADEYADFGHWSRESLNYRGLRWSEQRLYAHADAVVTLTESARRHLVDEVGWVPRTTPTMVVPCCVDTQRFSAERATREATRRGLGIGDELVVCYAGTLGSWYCDDEMAALFASIARRRPSRFLVLTRAPTDKLDAALRATGVADRVLVRAAAPRDMAALVAASDVGISFARPAFSKRASSPVKMAEYLSVGASMVLNRGVGDSDELIRESDVCFDAGDLSPDALERVAGQIAAATYDEPRRQAARALALRAFDLETVGIDRYEQLYRQLA